MRFGWLVVGVLLGACGTDNSGLALKSTRIEGDMLHVTYSGSCGQPRLAWTGEVDRNAVEARLRVDVEGEDGEGDCERELAVELTPIRDAFPEEALYGDVIRLLVPTDAGNESFSIVNYFPGRSRECSAVSARGLPPAVAADNFAIISELEVQDCGRAWVSSGSTCCEERTTGYDCLLKAYGDCAPARFGEGFGTTEGDPIFTDYFVMPTAEGCEIVVMRDVSQDAFHDSSSPVVSTAHCTVASLQIPSSGECAHLALDDCAL